MESFSSRNRGGVLIRSKSTNSPTRPLQARQVAGNKKKLQFRWMDSHIQTAPLIECPSYPNSVAWSEENLVAVASGSVITLLNPALITGPRGLIKLPPNRPFSIGVVKEEDLCAPCLMPISLSRDTRPCARSISWSPLGFAPNSGCLLAVCTTDGHVKLYRSPYCEYRVEWVEVIDISEMLSDYLASINFGEVNRSSECLDKQITDSNAEKRKVLNVQMPLHFCTCKMIIVSYCLSLNSNDFSVVVFMFIFFLRKGKDFESKAEKGPLLITAEQYASRSAMLSSLTVAWSSVLSLSSGSFTNCKYAVLAVGGKSGKISFWRFRQPEYYTIEHGRVSFDTKLVGLLQAHDGWINAISWEMLSTNPLKPQLLLASGSSDGSVRFWIMDGEELVTSSVVKFTSFRLLKEVISVTHIPISTLAMAVPMKSPDSFVLAIGKGSGSLEAWICNVSSSKFERVGTYNAHDQVVTGLAWGFDGCCLYSCSQVAFLLDPCFGLVLSPGNLVIAVVRGFDVDLLNPMYQARTQKAAVEFLWTCGPPVDHTPKNQTNSKSVIEGSSSLAEGNSSHWKFKILWSLNQYIDPEKPLVLWDILSVLLVFKQTAPSFVEQLLLEWLSSWFSDVSVGISIEDIPTHIQTSFPKISIRLIHLLNIICRRLVLPEMNTEEAKDGTTHNEAGKVHSWRKLLIHSETRVRVRVTTFSFQAALFGASHAAEASSSSGVWSPVGLTQMKQWVAINRDLVEDQLLVLLSKTDEPPGRAESICEDEEEESCGFCSSPVAFESPESAICKAARGHKLTRCAVSMQVSSVHGLQWFCICCQRWASVLLPSSFFSSDGAGHEIGRSALLYCCRPLCPFCGILLQRCAPNFLLSVNPV
ncbi:unnamed protein product [Spirodela intermedia]|uniref:Transcription factor IIIC 90kDa subunit N-terminal domain-containing protein n=1 Tax=Spirodela intermedia TaxID=51605 RepID=A0A7I8LNS6_SPIIN|nr:unnamed protein product [Spirodela intermedia]